MTPQRTNGDTGCYRFDRVFAGVGRIRSSSGTQSLREFHRRDALLTKLFETAQLELLRALADGRIAIEQLLEADRAGRVHTTLDEVLLQVPLWPAVSATLSAMRCSDATRRRYAISWSALRARSGSMLGDEARVADLARLEWDALAASWGKSGADWMHLRRAISRTLTVMLGDKWHPFRRKMVTLIPTARVRKRMPNLAPGRFLDVVAQTPEHLRPAFWTLVLTGMRVGEYLRCTRAHLRPAAHGLEVPGTKTEASAAAITVAAHLYGWLEQGIPSPVRYKRLRAAWVAACAAAGVADITLHDLRHCHGQWALNAGATEQAVQGSLRHENPAQTRDYVRQLGTHEVAAALGSVFPASTRRTRRGA